MYIHWQCTYGSLGKIVSGLHRLIVLLLRADFNSGQLNVGHKRLEHWVGIKWKCMNARERESRGKLECVCVSLKYLLLKQVTIPLGGSEYPSTTNHSTLRSFPSPNFSTWSSFTSPQREGQERRAMGGGGVELEGALAEAYTPAFSSNESQIPWNLFMLWAIDWLICFTCHLQFIISAASGRTYCYLWTASFSAFINWLLMHLVRTVPSSQLVHLLVAVEKVCAGGIVFAWLW